MPRAIIVTGGDTVYFPLMREMIASVRARPEGREIAIGVLDCGLAGEEAQWCRDQGAELVAPGWDIALRPDLPVAQSFRALTARPFLPRYFPGYATYLWLDADLWVQDWQAVALFLDAAIGADISIVPEMHRSYRNFRDGREDFEEANGKAYAQAYGFEVSRRLVRRPLNNAGAFAMRADSPGWTVWAAELAEAAERSTNMIDQIALNRAIHDGRIREARLPPTCNWIAHLATPAWDATRRLFVEPDPPYEPIGILHLTLGTKWSPSIDMAVVGGGRTARSLRYPG